MGSTSVPDGFNARHSQGALERAEGLSFNWWVGECKLDAVNTPRTLAFPTVPVDRRAGTWLVHVDIGEGLRWDVFTDAEDCMSAVPGPFRGIVNHAHRDNRYIIGPRAWRSRSWTLDSENRVVAQFCTGDGRLQVRNVRNENATSSKESQTDGWPPLKNSGCVGRLGGAGSRAGCWSRRIDGWKLGPNLEQHITVMLGHLCAQCQLGMWENVPHIYIRF